MNTHRVAQACTPVLTPAVVKTVTGLSEDPCCIACPTRPASHPLVSFHSPCPATHLLLPLLLSARHLVPCSICDYVCLCLCPLNQGSAPAPHSLPSQSGVSSCSQVWDVWLGAALCPHCPLGTSDSESQMGPVSASLLSRCSCSNPGPLSRPSLPLPSSECVPQPAALGSGCWGAASARF